MEAEKWPEFKIVDPSKIARNVLKFVGCRLYPFDLETENTGAEVMLSEQLEIDYGGDVGQI